MARKIRWAGICVVGGTLFLAGCRTTEERPPGGSASADASAPQPAATGATGTTGTTGATAADSQRGGATGAATSGAEATTAYELTGRVEAFDRAKDTVRIAGTTLKVDSSTSVKKDGVGATLDEVKEGDQVRASLSHGGDAPKAERIEVISSGTGKDSTTGSQQPGGTGTTR